MPIDFKDLSDTVNNVADIYNLLVAEDEGRGHLWLDDLLFIELREDGSVRVTDNATELHTTRHLGLVRLWCMVAAKQQD